jgi:S-DNA-T family DNA segregation ATPase FtsK/SpoIIIE
MKKLMKAAKGLGRILEESFQGYNAGIEILECQVIPDLLRYIFTVRPANGILEQRIFDRAKSIKCRLGLPLLYPYMEGDTIRIVVSEHDLKENRLLKILRSKQFSESIMKIPLALGYNPMGDMHIADLAKLLHLMIIGPSGTGKSVAMQCIILSIITRCPANSVKLLLFDIGGNSLSHFSNIVHLHHPIVKDVELGIRVLESLGDEMERRIALGENECQCLPFLVCMMDEFDDTISSIDDKKASDRFIAAMNSLILRGRKAKIILILVSHDPTLKNVKIKVNGIVPRIAFQCANHQNSSTALGVTGADKLPGEGAMLFKSQAGITHLQGAYVTPEEIEGILSNPPVDCDDGDKLQIRESSGATTDDDGNSDAFLGHVKKDKKELADAVLWVLGRDKVSIRQLQQKFQMGNRAASIIDELHRMNIVAAKFANQPRAVIPVTFEDLSPNVIAILSRHDYTEEQIKEAFADRGGDGL